MRRIDKSDWHGLAAGQGGDRQRLYRFAAQHGLAVDLIDVTGIWIAMAHVGAGDRAVTASGTGFDEIDAVAACLGEAVEVASWRWREADIARLLDTAAVAGLPRIAARAALGFSNAQVAARARLNRVWSCWDRIPPPDALDAPDRWLRAESFDGSASAACPAFLAFGGFGSAHGDATLDVDSNGCAAAANPEAARMAALLEAVERDAAGLWWHLGLIRPRLEAERTPDPRLRGAAATHRADTGRRLWFLHLPAIAPAAAIAAVSCEPDGSALMLGFGAALDTLSAARSAFRELVQGEVAREAWQVRSSRGLSAPEDCRLRRWQRHADVRAMRFVIGERADWPQGPTADTATLVASVRRQVGEPWFVELTRPEIGIPVMKAIVPGLAHFKPRHVAARLAACAHDPRATRRPGRLSDPHKLLV